MEREGPLRMHEAKGYIFDLDGTLAALPVNWDELRKRLDEIAEEPGRFRPIFPTIAAVVEEKPGLRPELFAAIDEFEDAAISSTRIFAGAAELLAKLSERAKVSLVTMQGWRATTRILEMYRLRQFLLSYFTREDSLDRPTQLELALTSMNVRKSDALFIGDRFNDLNAAKKVGIPFVLVRTHGEDPDERDVLVYHTIAEFASAVDC